MAKTQFEVIFAYFDSFADAAEVTGIPERTWRSWQESGFIPSKKHLQILVRARAKMRAMTAMDFSAHLVEQLIEHSESAHNETGAAVAQVAG